MKVLTSTGREEIAIAYVAEMEGGGKVEFVESVQPPLPRQKKWVLIVSSLFGCPVGCPICDAGGHYAGPLSGAQILEQLDFLVDQRFSGRHVPVEKFKIQFARMGEPSFNPAVLDVLEELPHRYDAPGLMPALSTIAPRGVDEFFRKLLTIKNRTYAGGRFQLQFSIHTTDAKLRNGLIPVRKWGFPEIAAYGARFYSAGDRKITLNFALADGMPVDPTTLLRHFSPDTFLIKITPVNPTHQAARNRIASYIDPCREGVQYTVIEKLRSAGYEVLLSIGEVEENHIGSNCGQYLLSHLQATQSLSEGYTYLDRAAPARRPS
jgi:23S rRNA (adenine2503-C2)-methyltransferase